jgi:hypothetical protein
MLRMLALLLHNIDDGGDTGSFGKFIVELSHLGGVLRVIQIDGVLEFLNVGAHFLAQLLERLRGRCELLHKIVDPRVECAIEVA